MSRNSPYVAFWFDRLPWLYIAETYKMNNVTESKNRPPKKSLICAWGLCLCLVLNKISFEPFMMSFNRWALYSVVQHEKMFGNNSRVWDHVATSVRLQIWYYSHHQNHKDSPTSPINVGPVNTFNIISRTFPSVDEVTISIGSRCMMSRNWVNLYNSELNIHSGKKSLTYSHHRKHQILRRGQIGITSIFVSQ